MILILEVNLFLLVFFVNYHYLMFIYLILFILLFIIILLSKAYYLISHALLDRSAALIYLNCIIFQLEVSELDFKVHFSDLISLFNFFYQFFEFVI